MSDDVVIEEAPPEAELAPPPEGEEQPAAPEAEAPSPEAEEEAQPAAEVAPEAPPEEIVPDEAPSEGPTEEPPAEEPRRGSAVHAGLTRFIGLTGGIGRGNRDAGSAREAGAATLSTDRVTHELLEDDQVRAALIERWGRVAPGDGVIATASGRSSSRPRRAGLPRGVLHPRVGVHVLEWRESRRRRGGRSRRGATPLRSGDGGAFDATVAVVAGDEIREARLRERGQLEEREGRQLDQAEKERRADHVIRNEGSIEELESKVSELIDQIKANRGMSPDTSRPWPLALQSQWQPLEQAPHGSDDEPAALTATPPRDGRRRHPDRRCARRLPDREQRPLPADTQEVTLPLRHEDIIRQQAREKDVPADLIAA